ncbi:hypothetical protein [Frankia sp. AgB32]|uniref:hypothetical protein n=1 Tax=Frankia sp. AgB32 TaxID=631119 RepID=UPI00200D7BFB|nr:hypothetical protein [Frankia sp. AgB32]MCK9893374.1 hypothetical protein [Frankia sp. AgB32]
MTAIDRRTIDRREFSALTGLTLVAAAHEWLVADPARIAAALNGRRADTSVIADLTTTTDALRRLDDKLGGQAVHNMIVEQLRLVVRVLKNASYTETDGQALHGIAAELARMAGWTSYDSGQNDTAQRFYLVGLRAAHQADSPSIAANILRCMAHQARSTGDPKTAISLLRSARTGARGRLTATEHALIAASLTRAYGLTGERDQALAYSDIAYGKIEQSKPDDDPPYMYWVGPHTVAHATGSSLADLGNPGAAIPHLVSAVEQVDDEVARDLLEYSATLALAHARAGDSDEAISLAHRAISSTTIPSTIVGTELAELCRQLRADGHPGAAELADHVRAVAGPAVV